MMRRKNWIAPIVLLISFMGVTPVWAEPLDKFIGQKGQINIAGGTAHVPVMTGAARKILEKNPEITITVAGGGSGVGVRQVGEGLAHIGNTGRPLREEEIKKYGLVSFPFAIDGVAAVVHPQNPITELNNAQLKDIFMGHITNWQSVGGPDAGINLYVREDGSGTREVFENKALNKKEPSPAANVVSSNGAMKTTISRDENSIGYLGIGYLDESVKGLMLEGLTPNQENLTNGTYQVSRLLYMNTKGQPQGIVKDFIDYIYSSDGALLIRQSGYIPSGPR